MKNDLVVVGVFQLAPEANMARNRLEAEGIRAVISERRAAFVVQGAYGHSRLRETLFGGVTRGLLANAPVPLFLAH